MKVVVKKGSGGLKKLGRAAKNMPRTVVAGVLAGATNSDTGESVAAYAQYLEYGTESMSPRPFLRTTAKGCTDKWKKQLKDGLKAKGVEGAASVLGAVGRVMRADIVLQIKNGTYEPLAKSTVKAKERKKREKPATPLINTTSLLKSISSEVRR